MSERFTLSERLYEGPVFTLHRALDTRDGSRVVLKRLSPERAAPAHVERLRREHAILQELALPGVVKAKEMYEHEGTLDLVLEDFRGETLAAYLSRQKLDLATALALGADLAETLGQIHGRRVIHKDINPKNIVVDARFRAQVIDFGLATRLPREIQALKNPNVIEGTLAYISPEQTGRMNRAVDYRADLYSLGATLYTMLTGRIPFAVRDPLELVHAHIAKVPVPPHEVDPAIPEVVSAIVMRLLEKAAEARYQSAFGLRVDLDECRQRLREGGRVEAFPLGRSDTSGRFELPQKLYGRREELARLEAAFDRVSKDARELLLISGVAGAGKSALVRELHRSIGRRGGLFIASKFEELERDIPYSAVISAFTELCHYLLAEGEEPLARSRRKLTREVGSAGRALVEIVPDLALLFGELPPLPALPPGAAQNRLRYAFQRFLAALTEGGKPLVLFLDDLQWADGASRSLLEGLLNAPEPAALLVIGAYRDNEVDPAHPLALTIGAIESAGCPVERIALGPLTTASLEAMLEEMLARPADEIRPLAELVEQKTHGNAFFAGQFLSALYRNGLLTFDSGLRRWAWDLRQIEGAPITDNVIELVAARARSLSERTQRALELAACIGSEFDRATLALVHERAPAEIEALLVEAVTEGLVVAVGAERYRFLHDRVQEAVYQSLPERAQAEAHLTIGKLLLASEGEEAAASPRLFDILHHLNDARSLIASPEERLELARLNLAAGQRARASAAFGPASAYFTTGIGLMPEDAFVLHHDVAYQLYLGSAECEYVNSRFEAAEPLFRALLAGAGSPLEKARVHELRGVLRSYLGQYNDAIAAALEALSLLGIDLSPRPSWADVILEIARTKSALGDRSPSELLDVPEATDPKAKRALALLALLCAMTFLINPNLFATSALRSLRLSANPGVSSASAIGYIQYAIFAGARLGDHDEQEAYGRLALAHLERFPDKSNEAVIKCLYATVVQPWRHPLRDTFATLRAAIESSMEAGELNYAPQAAAAYVVHLFLSGGALAEVCEEAERWLSFGAKIRHAGIGPWLFPWVRGARALMGATASTRSFAQREGEEAEYVERISRGPHKLQLQLYWLAKRMSLYLLGHHDEAFALSELAAPTVDGLLGARFWLVEHYHYSSLLYASRAEGRGVIERAKLLLKIRDNQRRMAAWAARAPANFRHKHLLVEAERARLLGDARAASQHYEAAIAGARENQFQQDEAVALELTGKFYLSRGLSDAGRMYLARARRAYARWGASAKVAALDRAHPGLEALVAANEGLDKLAITTTTASTSTTAALDAPSMIKASQALSGEISVDRLVARLMQVVIEGAGAERASLLLATDGAQLGVAAEIDPQAGTTRISPPVAPGPQRRIAPAIVHYVARTQKSVVLGDAAREGAFVKDAYVEAHQPRSVLCMPLVQQGELKGVLYLENNLAPHVFTQERVELLRVLCAQMAISIENASLYAGLERKVEERTRELREAQAHLMKLERDAAEVQMAGGFAHEMRNALAGAKIHLAGSRDQGGKSLCADTAERLASAYRFLRTLHDDRALAPVRSELRAVGKNMDRLENILRQMERGLDRALGITSLILEYSRLGHEQPGREAVALRPLVDAVLEAAAGDLAALEIATEIAIPEGRCVRGKPDHLRRIVEQLVRNAKDALAAKEGAAPRRLRIELVDDHGRAVLRVADNGVGIEDQDRGEIFKPFFSTRPATSAGLGLAMVEKLVSLCQGSITFESEPGRGATFSVALRAESDA